MPPSATPYWKRYNASPRETHTLSSLIHGGRSPFTKSGRPSDSMEGLNRRMALATIIGMTNAAARQAGVRGGHIQSELEPVGPDGDGAAYMWGTGNPGEVPDKYGIVMRPGYIGSPRGLDATIRHEVAHVRDVLKNKNPELVHGPSFRREEREEYVPNLKLRPNYKGDDYTGQHEYAEDYTDLNDPRDFSKRYIPHVYLSDYDDARVRPYKVNLDDLVQALAVNRKRYHDNLKNPPVPRLRTGPAVRGL